MGQMPENLKPYAFKPGNKAAVGHKRNGWNVITELKKALAAEEKQDRQGRTRARLLAEATILKAIKGDHRARRDVLEYLHGKPESTVQVDTPEGPRTFKVCLSLEEVEKTPNGNGDANP